MIVVFLHGNGNDGLDVSVFTCNGNDGLDVSVFTWQWQQWL